MMSKSKQHRVRNQTMEDKIKMCLLRSIKQSNGCLLYHLKLTPRGYASTNLKGKGVRVHRAVWEHFNGPISNTKLVVCHTCDNRACINIDHLFLGTQMDNIKDMKSKDRHLYGERRPNAKLTDAKVRWARSVYKPRDKKYSARALAKKMSVTSTAMELALNRKTWTHVV